MSTKKKLHKEKEDIKATKCTAFILTSDKASVVRSNDYPLSSDGINILYGRPYGALNCSDWLALDESLDRVVLPATVISELEKFAHENLRRGKDQSLPKLVPSLQGPLTEYNREAHSFAMSNWTPRQLQRQWEERLVAQLGSLVVYPRHWVSFSYAPYGNVSVEHELQQNPHCTHVSSHSAYALAEVVTRLVAAYTEWNNILFHDEHGSGMLERLQQRSMSISYSACSARDSIHSFLMCDKNHYPDNTNPPWSGISSRNVKEASLPQGYEPIMDVRKLLGVSIRSTFSSCNSPSSSVPEGKRRAPLMMKEERDVSFYLLTQRKGTGEAVSEERLEGRAPTGENASDLLCENTEKTSVEFVGHFNSTYVNVCCGKYFYQLPILDTEKRTLKSISSLSLALDMLYLDVQERETAFQQLNVSDEAQEDFREFYSLLSRVSGTPNRIREDIYRRLCEVSEVNAHNLSVLEGAQFTIIINGPSKPSERVADAQWLHSVFSLHFQWDQPEEFCATTAAVVSADTVLLFLKKALAGPHPGGSGVMGSSSTAHRHAVPTAGIGSGAEGLAGGLRKGSPRTSANTIDAAVTAAAGFGRDSDKLRKDVTSNRNPGGDDANITYSHSAEKPFIPLDLWLPLKHRAALRPYSPMCSLSHKWHALSSWFPQSSGSQFSPSSWSPPCLTVSQFCLLVILAIERVVCTENFHSKKGEMAQRPSVLFAYHHPECTCPSVVSLVTDEVVEWIQAVRTPSALITQEVRQSTKQRAIESVTWRLQRCIESPISLYGLSRSAYLWAKNEEPADMCLSFSFLTHNYQRNCCAFKVLSTGSDLRVSSRMIINGLALQTRPEKRVMFGSGDIYPGDLGVAPKEEALGKAFLSALSTEISQF